MTTHSTTKKYIGDGVYVDYDGYALVLTAENGLSVQHRIVLERDVWIALLHYVDAHKVRNEDPRR